MSFAIACPFCCGLDRQPDGRSLFSRFDLGDRTGLRVVAVLDVSPVFVWVSSTPVYLRLLGCERWLVCCE